MNIKRVAVKNIRSHTDKIIDLSATTTVLVGKNGAGKTSLLEAVYIALQGSSFKGSDNDLLRHGAPWYRIDLLLDDDTTRSVLFDPAKPSGKKKFIVHDKTSYRLSLRDKYPVVLFEPEDLRLLHGSPSRRRQFIDQFIMQIDPAYSTTLRKYERALKQRNALLKKESVRDEDIFVWNITLSEYGSAIIERRVRAIELINKELNEHYHTIAHTDDKVSVHYSHTLIGRSSQKLLHEIEARLQYDKTVGYTSIGPHRHDVIFHFNDTPALSIASRGEVRTILLALKRIEIMLIKDITGQMPFILLDDVFSELDRGRQESILDDSCQMIVTSTEYNGKNVPGVATIDVS